MKSSKEMLSPKHAADFLICECRERGEILTNLKLQKLLYYAQAWYLALHEQELFSEDFQAWVHGPALPSQYKRFKKFEWRPILEEMTMPSIKNKKVRDHLMEIVDVFGSETATALELMTHNELPWKKARGAVPVDHPSISIISKELMKAFYKNL